MRSAPLPAGKKKYAASEALVGLFAVVVFAAVVAALYLGRELLVPLALAALLTFMLSPLVTRLEHVVGRIGAVATVVILVAFALGGLAWMLSHQAVELAAQLPDYRGNIEKKIHAIQVSKDGRVSRFSKMIADLAAELPGFGPVPARPEEAASAPATKPAANAPVAAPPQVNLWSKTQALVGSLVGIVGTAGLVGVLVIYMLLKREDLRGRLIKMLGQGRITSTSRAMEDAGARVSRYLIAQLVVNVALGFTVGIGLHYIGVPTAFLWGALAAILRFIPYVGVWIAAIGPAILALAVSPDWGMLLQTIGLFLVLELSIANFLEPLLYRSSTGVSSIGLIVSAIFWTWLWGPMGLLLSTPLTVCIGVIGRHVPRLEFLSVLLGDEEALTPTEECYHLLLSGGLNEAGKVMDTYINANSLTAMYDQIIVPIVTLAEVDFEREDLDEAQRDRVMRGVRDLVDELSSRPVPVSKIEADRAVANDPPLPLPKMNIRVLCISTRGQGDEVASYVLAHLLRQQGCESQVVNPGLELTQLAQFVDEFKPDAVCLSVIPPTTLIHARHLSSRLRARFETLRIVVGIWGATEGLDDAVKGLRYSGTDEVAVSMAEGVLQLTEMPADSDKSVVSAEAVERLV